MASIIDSGARCGERRDTGIHPKFYERLKQCGFVLPTQMFQTVAEIN